MSDLEDESLVSDVSTDQPEENRAQKTSLKLEITMFLKFLRKLVLVFLKMGNKSSHAAEAQKQLVSHPATAQQQTTPLLNRKPT